MTATTQTTPQENAEPTRTQKLLGVIHHMAQGVANSGSVIIFSFLGVGYTGIGAAGVADGGAIGASVTSLVGGITCLIGSPVSYIVKSLTNRYRDCVSPLKQARLNEIGKTALVGTSVAIGGITGGLYAHNKLSEERPTQTTAQPSPKKASSFSVTQEGAGDCTVIFKNAADPKVASGNCTVTQKATKTPTSGGASLTPAQ